MRPFEGAFVSRLRARYTEGDMARIFKAAAKAHVDVTVTVDSEGNIVIITSKADETSGSESMTPLEEWRRKKDRGQS